MASWLLKVFLLFLFPVKLTQLEIPHSQPLPVLWSQFKRLRSRNKLCLHLSWRHLVRIHFTSAFTEGFSDSSINVFTTSFCLFFLRTWLFWVRRKADGTVSNNGSLCKVQGVLKEPIPKKISSKMLQERKSPRKAIVMLEQHHKYMPCFSEHSLPYPRKPVQVEWRCIFPG